MSDTKGRTRAAKSKAAKLVRDSIRRSMRAPSEGDEEEVFFHPRYEGEDSSEQGELEIVTDAEASGQSSMRDSRLDLVENDMAEVKAKVDNMDAKLDLLLNSAVFSKPAAASTPPRTTRTAHEAQRGPLDLDHSVLPPPRVLRSRENEGGYIDDMLKKERFAQPHHEGKANLAFDIFSDKVMPKPYMYAIREGAHTLKQKLDIRPTLSFAEYVNASIALIRDNRAFNPGDREHILEHIQDVTQDALERPWEGTRKWSQHIRDEVEKGRLAWTDHQSIHNKRCMMAILGSQRPSATGESVKGNSRRECICRAFNSRGGCRQRSHHDEGQVRFMHLCAYCDSVGRQCTGHNVIECDSKLRAHQGRSNFGQGYGGGSQPTFQAQYTQARAPAPEAMWRASANQYQNHYNLQQQPKNA